MGELTGFVVSATAVDQAHTEEVAQGCLIGGGLEVPTERMSRTGDNVGLEPSMLRRDNSHLTFDCIQIQSLRTTVIIPPKAITVKQGQLPILNLSERELLDPEGVGFDLRLSGIHTIEGKGSLLVETRQTPKATPLDPDSDGVFTLEPKRWYLATTMERMNLPSQMAGMIFPRSTLFRSGVELHTSITPPGYEGPLTFGLSVNHPEEFRIAVGARFCHIVLMQVRDGSTKYRGQWNQGRIDSPNEERQV